MSVQDLRSKARTHISSLSDWSSSDGSPSLGEGDVRVWLARLDDPLPPSAALALTHEERSRAGVFADPAERKRFVASRTILRALLSRYAGEEPKEMEVRVPPAGKPYLASAKVKFNLSHSHGVGLFALSRDLEVGVDIEKETPLPGASALRKRFLAEKPERGGFFRAWAREEAAVKARGLGVQHMGMERRRPVPGMTGIHLHDISAPGPFSAALAVEGPRCEPKLVLFSWPACGLAF